MIFKKNKVWLATDQDQKPITKNGKVLIKYQLDQDYEYWILSKNIKPTDSLQRKEKTEKGEKSTRNSSEQKGTKTKSDTEFLADTSCVMPLISTQTAHLQEIQVRRESAWFCALANMKKRYQDISVLPPTTWQNSKPSGRVLWL